EQPQAQAQSGARADAEGLAGAEARDPGDLAVAQDERDARALFARDAAVGEEAAQRAAARGAERAEAVAGSREANRQDIGRRRGAVGRRISAARGNVPPIWAWPRLRVATAWLGGCQARCAVASARWRSSDSTAAPKARRLSSVDGPPSATSRGTRRRTRLRKKRSSRLLLSSRHAWPADASRERTSSRRMLSSGRTMRSGWRGVSSCPGM